MDHAAIGSHIIASADSRSGEYDSSLNKSWAFLLNSGIPRYSETTVD
jgi:hypothetical protein